MKRNQLKNHYLSEKILFSTFFILFFFLIIPLANTEALSVLNRCSVTESSIFTKANDFYRGGQYPQAIEEYKKIEKTGFESGNLYYNLGNCYFKTGHLGQAVLYYEKAAKLIPRDSDLKSNYALAKTKTSGYNVIPKQNFILKLSAFLFEGLTTDELTVIMSLLYMVCIGIFLLRVFRPALNLSLRPVLFIALVFFVFGVYSLAQKIKLDNKEVIVLFPQTKVRFEPFKKATVFFELSEGAKAAILQRKGNWVKITRSDGKTGWVLKDAIALI